jgi:hypothetical protein
MTFTDTQLGMITNALRVASDQFKENARELDGSYPRLADQFRRQASDNTALYNAIAERTGVAN